MVRTVSGAVDIDALFLWFRLQTPTLPHPCLPLVGSVIENLRPTPSVSSGSHTWRLSRMSPFGQRDTSPPLSGPDNTHPPPKSSPHVSSYYMPSGGHKQGRVVMIDH